MEIELFVSKSVGEWISMRSGHSLAFKQFEEIISEIQINLINPNEAKVHDLLTSTGYKEEQAISPFEMTWEGTSNWDNTQANNNSLKGHSLLIPIKHSSTTGIILRSKGYAEASKAISKYKIFNDGTILLTTIYHQTIAEERIWFVHDNVRCRSSVIKSKSISAILQTSFASEIRNINS